MSRRTSKIDVNMFPFLSVLCSMIGVMMLFILSIISTRIIDAETVAAPAPQAAPDPGSGGLGEDEFLSLQQEIDDLARRRAVRQRELEQMQRSMVRLRQLLAIKTDEMELSAGDRDLRGANIGPELNVEMAPADDQRITERPLFVEVDFEGYLLHPEKRRFKFDEIPDLAKTAANKQSAKSPLKQFLGEVYARREREYLVFLIRPSGAEAFTRIHSYLTRTYPHEKTSNLSQIRIGWEPFSSEWLLVSDKLAR